MSIIYTIFALILLQSSNLSNDFTNLLPVVSKVELDDYQGGNGFFIENMSKRKFKTNNDFIKELLLRNKYYKLKQFETLSDFEDYSKPILLRNRFGLMKTTPKILLKGCEPTIKSAVDKNAYFAAQAREIHGDLYDYSKVDYKRSDKKVIIICPIHGDFPQAPVNHLLAKQGCGKCNGGVLSNKEEFIRKAKLIHGEKYDYSKVKYKLATSVIKIICNKCKKTFPQKTNDHLSGHGCSFCGRENINKYQKENPTGWTLTNWIKAKERSKHFDSYKVYIIRLFNGTESFYKIGRTFNIIERRFSCNNKISGYNLEIIKIIESKTDAKYIWELERDLKRLHKEHKYLPKQKFGGMHECFSEILIDKTNNI